MGRIDKEKGIFDLLESFKIIANKYDNILLLLVGKDEMEIEHYLQNNYHQLIKK